MIDKIIEQIKSLPEEQLLEFNNKYQEFYKQEKKKQASNKRKKSKEREKKACELGDKICELLGIKGFPFTGIQLRTYYPYKPDIIEDNFWEIVKDVLQDNSIIIPAETWDNVLEYESEFLENTPKSWWYSDSDMLWFEGQPTYTFYMKGGWIEEVEEEEIAKYIL